MFRFADPYLLLFLIIVPLPALMEYRKRRKGKSHLLFPDVSVFGEISPGWRVPAARYLFVLELLALSLIVLALARPQRGTSYTETTTHGVDIIIALDSSTSMLAEDFQPKNRLKVAREVSAEFIDQRTHDRIGLISFAGVSYTRCPLTLDYGILKNLLARVETGQIKDGTAIGMALANAVNRLKDSEAESKVVILVTDGINNRGKIEPVTAAELAEALNVKVYTVGVGSRGPVPYPVETRFGVRYRTVRIEIDEETLKEIAGITGGEYYRATDESTLESVFDTIDELEKTEIKSKIYTNYTELFPRFLLPGLALFVLFLLLKLTAFRRFP